MKGGALLLTILFLSAVNATLIHTHISQITDVPCETTKDCLAFYGNDWCHRGTFCLRHQCHTIPFFPCKQGEQCLSSENRCVSRHCSLHGDCDDGLFCNGVERCINSTCIPDDRFHCPFGLCSEKDKACYTPLSLKDVVIPDQVQQNTESGAFRATFHNTTDVNEHVRITTIVIIVIAGIFFAVVLVVLLVSRASRPYSPVIVFDKNGGGGGNEIYLQQVHYQ